MGGYIGSFLGVKRSELEFDLSSPSSAELKNVCVCVCIYLYFSIRLNGTDSTNLMVISGYSTLYKVELSHPYFDLRFTANKTLVRYYDGLHKLAVLDRCSKRRSKDGQVQLVLCST